MGTAGVKNKVCAVLDYLRTKETTPQQPAKTEPLAVPPKTLAATCTWKRVVNQRRSREQQGRAERSEIFHVKGFVLKKNEMCRGGQRAADF